MKRMSIGLIVLAAGSAMADTTITKGPDVGDYWYPLSPNGGTYVYADSFIAPAGSDVLVSRIGTWLNAQGTGGSSVRFEIWGDLGSGNGPDASNVISSTGSLGAFANSSLTYYEAASSPGTLSPGQLYWFAATVVGESGPGLYNVGGHTQNSVYNDNGTFWYSNDPSGVNFDGRGLTPEMAFSLTLTQVPAPGAAAALGLAGLVATRRRR